MRTTRITGGSEAIGTRQALRRDGIIVEDTERKLSSFSGPLPRQREGLSGTGKAQALARTDDMATMIVGIGTSLVRYQEPRRLALLILVNFFPLTHWMDFEDGLR